jgi:peptidoglycan-N-acetylglucosamine deacetylase
MIRFFKPPRWITWFYPRFTWRFSVSDNTVFLTFDDGPHPEITPFILDELKKRNWTATFFCVGENLTRYPEIVERILQEGHQIGNHTQTHLKGSTTSFEEYQQSFDAFERQFQTPLFRPPYGKMTKAQAKHISETHQIILWSWLSYDYDLTLDSAVILKKSKQIQPGSIVVLHDNPKIKKRQHKLVPALFDLLEKRGFHSKAITV